MKRLVYFYIVAALFAVDAASEPLSRDSLLAMLRSDNANQRAVARQMLPRYGVERLEDILPVLADTRDPVWRTASNVLTDLANEVSTPGREGERRVLSDALLARLVTQPAGDEAARLLNIVGYVLPDGTDVGPIAAYLSDESLRMNARDALQLAGTPESRRALRTALIQARGTFALALIDSMRALRDADAQDVIAQRLDDEDPAVRIAAVRGLAWTGDADLIPTFRQIVSTAPNNRKIEAADAYLALIDAVYASGGEYDRAMDAYAWAVKEFVGPVMRGAAIASLGRHGDDRAVPVILEAIRREGPGKVDHAALEALAVLRGENVTRAIQARQDDLLAALGPSLYGVYGRRGDAAFTPTLIDALRGDDAYARHVAAQALMEANHPDGISAVAEYAGTLDEEPRAALVNRMELLAAASRNEGRGDVAGAAYAGLYRLAATDKSRQFALDGMMQYPSEEAFAIVKDLIGQEDLESLSVQFLAGIARALYAAKQDDDAGRVLDALLPRLTTPQDVQAFLQTARGGGFAARLGFVLDWHVVGPFAWSSSDQFKRDYIGAPDVVLTATYDVAGEKRAWNAARASDTDGVLNLIGSVGNVSNAACYAYAELALTEAVDAVMRLGSDDGVKVWVNGEVVHENHVDRGLLTDQDLANVTLNAGTNRILIEVTQGGGGWAMCARLTDRDGRPLQFGK